MLGLFYLIYLLLLTPLDHDNIFCILKKNVRICGHIFQIVIKLIMFCLTLLMLSLVFFKAQL